MTLNYSTENIPQLSNYNTPNLAFVIFKCGKNMNSKVKFERFMIIINNHSKLSKSDLSQLTQKLYLSVRKVLTSGKQGVKF